MNIEFFLPGAVILLKAVLRASIDKHLTGPIALRGFVLFPVDIIFLSFSYSVAVGLVISGGANAAASLSKFPVFAVVAYILISIIVLILCSKTERFIDAKAMIRAAILCFTSYAISIFVLLFSLGGYVFG